MTLANQIKFKTGQSLLMQVQLPTQVTDFLCKDPTRSLFKQGAAQITRDAFTKKQSTFIKYIRGLSSQLFETYLEHLPCYG